LYVGDLKPDTNEQRLYEIFNEVGPVASIRICRDAVTRMSLGYGYVNFHNVGDADRAIDIMNFQPIDGRPCRIMWSQRDPALRKSGVGNIVVKNLAPSITNKDMYDLFAGFGAILSCKVVTDEKGTSKGYGYIHFETDEAAAEAIAQLNGKMVEDQEVFVGPFVKRGERSSNTEFTNLYVKQFPEDWDEDKLMSLFAEFGEISSVSIPPNEDGTKNKGFGFVNFVEHTAAAAAIEALHDKTFDAPEPLEGEEPAEDKPAAVGPDGEPLPDDGSKGWRLYVQRFQKKNERSREMKAKADSTRQERTLKFQGMNLYVKNLDDGVTEEQLRELFAPFGTITSSRIMKDESGLSRGFGFVCYSSAEEATRAVQELNNRIFPPTTGKPIVVTLHQRKEMRQQHLANQFQGGMAGPGRGPSGRNFNGPGQPMPYMPMSYMGGPQGGMARQPPQQPFMMNGMMGRPPRNNLPQAYRNQGGSNGTGYPMSGPGGYNPAMQQMGAGFRKMGNPQGQGRGPSGAGRGGAMGGAGPAGAGRGMQQSRNNMMAQQPRGPNIKFTGQARNQPMQQMMMPPHMMPPQGMMPPQPPQQQQQQPPKGMPESLDHSQLAQADPQTQKNMIGERLYPLIHRQHSDLAGKITGMLLEMDNAELLHLIDTPEALDAKMEEALAVLKQSRAAEE
jgi:polyadenylate-binding protein